MKRILVAFLLFVFCIPALAQYTKFTPLLTPPNGSSLSPISINNANQILATFNNASGQRKLIFAGTKGFTNVNIPLDTSTVSLFPTGLNSVGDFYGRAIRLIGLNRIDEAFTKCHTAGPLRYFKIPDALGTVITGINDKGVVVGYYSEPDPDAPDWAPKYQVHGFKSVLQNSGFFPPTVSFDFAGVPYSYVTGINNNGDIVGYYQYPDFEGYYYIESGFLLSKGQLYELVWDAQNGEKRWPVIPLGINNHGVIVGRTYPPDDPGFVRGFALENGTVSIVNFPDNPAADPGATLTKWTELRSINDSGVIIGWYDQELSFAPWDRRGGFILTK